MNCGERTSVLGLKLAVYGQDMDSLCINIRCLLQVVLLLIRGNIPSPQSADIL